MRGNQCRLPCGTRVCVSGRGCGLIVSAVVRNNDVMSAGGEGEPFPGGIESDYSQGHLCNCLSCCIVTGSLLCCFGMNDI
jgi:hypothetical protein